MNSIKFEDYKQKIIDGFNNAYPGGFQCGCKQHLLGGLKKQGLSLIDGFFNQSIQNELSGGLTIGGPTIPMIGLVCNNCGKIHFFAFKALVPNIEM